jgi:hypothetical protein
MYSGSLMPFDHPDDPALFFEWLWDELFGDEDYHLANPDDYVIDDDYEGPTEAARARAAKDKQT